MNKRVANIFLIVGIASFLVGSVFYIAKEFFKDKDEALKIMVPASSEEKTEIAKYLYDRYGEEFDVLEHTTTFCVVQDIEKDDFTLDANCEIDDIKNDIYKASDKSGLTFYVKKVTLKDGIELIDKLKKSQFNIYYDNYISFVSARNLANDIKYKFNDYGDLASISVIKGLGIEKPKVEMKDGKYLSYIVYADMDSDYIGVASKNISLRDFIVYLNSVGKKDTIDLSIKYNNNLTVDNVQQIVQAISNSDLLSASYGILVDTVILEFNNGLYMKYDSEYNIRIYNSYNYYYEKDSTLAYPKVITYDLINRGDNIIYYDDFISLDKSKLNLIGG